MKQLSDKVVLVRGAQIFNLTLGDYYYIMRGDRHYAGKFKEVTQGAKMWPVPGFWYFFHRGMRN